MMNNLRCFCFVVTSGKGDEAKSVIYYVMAENAVQATGKIKEAKIELGTSFELAIEDDVQGFIFKNVESVEDAAIDEVAVGQIGAVKMTDGHYMLFNVTSEDDVVNNITRDTVEVVSNWTDEGALIF